MNNKLLLTIFLIFLTPTLVYAAENSVEKNFTKIKIFSPWGYPDSIINNKLTIVHKEKVYAGLARLLIRGQMCGDAVQKTSEFMILAFVRMIVVTLVIN